MICGTAYIKADSAEEAQKLLDEHYFACVNEDLEISDLPLDDPDLPKFSLSPAMTLYGKCSEIEEAE